MRPEATPMSLVVGTGLGPYEIQSAIGAGGIREVHKAGGTSFDFTVAIKPLPAHVNTDPERRARFERVAKTISALNHPHICTLQDVGEQDVPRFSGRCRTWRPSNSRGSQRMGARTPWRFSFTRQASPGAPRGRGSIRAICGADC
jgi:hypothetical protein